MTIAGMTLLYSCGESAEKKNTDLPEQEQTEVHAENSKTGNLDDAPITASPEFETPEITAVYQHYLHLKSALVNSDADQAQAAGESLVGALAKIEAEQALVSAQEIAGTADLNIQRTAFSDLTAEVENILVGALVSGNVYKQYCPMAFSGKGGYWLSDSEEIRNPYFGSKMLKCGSVRDTLE